MARDYHNNPRDHLKYCCYIAKKYGYTEAWNYNYSVIKEKVGNGVALAGIGIVVGGVVICEWAARSLNQIRSKESDLVGKSK